MSNSVGRPAFEITEDVLKQVETYAAQGLTRDQIARCLSISDRTVYEKQKEFPQFLQAIQDGKAKGVSIISNALFGSAKDGHFPAQRYYLQNRAPEAWRDSTDIVHKGDVRVTHEVIAISEIDRWITNSDEGTKEADGQKALPDGPVLPALEGL